MSARHVLLVGRRRTIGQRICAQQRFASSYDASIFTFAVATTFASRPSPVRSYATLNTRSSASTTSLVRTAAEKTDEGDDEGRSSFRQRARAPPPWYSRPVVWVLGSMPVLTLMLGIWQVKRLRWKLDLIDELESKLKREPLRLPKNVDLDVLLTHYTNRLFTLSGHFPASDADSVLFLGPRVRDGQVGYHVVQTLVREGGGGSVIVDRGFIAKEKIVNNKGDASTWRLPESVPASEARSRLLLLPRPKERNRFTPVNDPRRHIWHFADVDELASFFGRQDDDTIEANDAYTPSHGIAESVRSMLGLNEDKRPSQIEVLPVFFEEIFEGNVADAARNLQLGIPVGRAATVELRNQHAVYAATWFSLSAATSVMFALLLRRPPKG